MAYNTAIVRGDRSNIQTNIKAVLDTLSIAPGTMPNTIITKTGADNFVAVITYELAAGASTPPLPSGAATAVNQTNGNQQTKITDGTNVAGVTAANELKVKLDSDIQIGAVEIKDGATETRAKVKSDGADNALVVTQNDQPLPTGAATSVKQLLNDHDVNVSNMIPAVETGLSTSAKQLPDGHNVSVNNMIPSVETGLAKSANQLPDDHNVTVSNMIPAVETGLATSALQTTGNSSLSSIDGKMNSEVEDDSIPAGQTVQLIAGQLYAYDGSNWVRVMIDPSTHAMSSIEYEHHEIHAGNSFVSDVVDLTMASAATLIIAFKTPDTTTWLHLVIGSWSATQHHVDIIEAPTWTTQTGSQNPVHNRNRNSNNTTTVLEDSQAGGFADTNNVVLNPTGLAGGTIIHDFYAGAGKNQSGVTRDVAEIILKRNTQYAIRLTTDAASSAGQLILNWYEHADLT